MIVQGDGGRSSVILVHCEPRPATYDLDRLTRGRLIDGPSLVKIDHETGNGVSTQRCDGRVTFAGYGVAVVTNAVAGCDVGAAADWV